MNIKTESTNCDRVKQLGIAIRTVRELRGMSQEQLASKVGISITRLNAIESADTSRSVNINDFFCIADALNVDPSDLINGSSLLEKLTK